jgi:hypothetical protein
MSLVQEHEAQALQLEAVLADLDAARARAAAAEIEGAMHAQRAEEAANSAAAAALAAQTRQADLENRLAGSQAKCIRMEEASRGSKDAAARWQAELARANEEKWVSFSEERKYSARGPGSSPSLANLPRLTQPAICPTRPHRKKLTLTVFACGPAGGGSPDQRSGAAARCAAGV